jgi:hypothetical protein
MMAYHIDCFSPFPLKTPKVRIRACLVEIDMNDVQVMAAAPDLYPALGKARINPGVIAQGRGIGRAAGILVGAFRADNRLSYGMKQMFHGSQVGGLRAMSPPETNRSHPCPISMPF